MQEGAAASQPWPWPWAEAGPQLRGQAPEGEAASCSSWLAAAASCAWEEAPLAVAAALAQAGLEGAGLEGAGPQGVAEAVGSAWAVAAPRQVGEEVEVV